MRSAVSPCYSPLDPPDAHLDGVEDQVRQACASSSLAGLCFGEASLRPLAGIRVPTLIEPAERVADLQPCTNGARLRTFAPLTARRPRLARRSALL